MKDMTAAEALEVARRIAAFNEQGDLPSVGERAAVALAGEVIALRQEMGAAIAAWRQDRARALVTPELRKALDAFAERWSS